MRGEGNCPGDDGKEEAPRIFMKKKKQPHLIGVLKYYLSPFGKAMSPIPAVNSDA